MGEFHIHEMKWSDSKPNFLALKFLALKMILSFIVLFCVTAQVKRQLELIAL